MQNNPIMQYKQQSINTMSKGEQLVLLYDEVLKNMRYGSMMLKEKNYPTAEKCTEKCKKIINYFSSVLDNKYPLSAELHQLYYFINQEIIRAEVKRDNTVLDDLIPLVDNLRETWVQAEKLSHMNK